MTVFGNMVDIVPKPSDVPRNYGKFLSITRGVARVVAALVVVIKLIPQCAGRCTHQGLGARRHIVRTRMAGLADANTAEGVVPLPFETTEGIVNAADEVTRGRETRPKTVSINRKSARRTAKISPYRCHRKPTHRTTFNLPREFRCAAIWRKPCIAKEPSMDIIPVIGKVWHASRGAKRPEGRRAES